jgi:hypothetical protein
LLPTAMPPHCDGCGERFTTEHAMSCRKGGLILHRHNDMVTMACFILHLDIVGARRTSIEKFSCSPKLLISVAYSIH